MQFDSSFNVNKISAPRQVFCGMTMEVKLAKCIRATSDNKGVRFTSEVLSNLLVPYSRKADDESE